MAQQHDLPPAFLRTWWSVPNWSRMLPVVGGVLLAPMALCSISPAPHQAPGVAVPATPSIAPRTQQNPPAAMVAAPSKATETTAVTAVESLGATGTTAASTRAIPASSSSASGAPAKPAVVTAVAQPLPTQAIQPVQQPVAQPVPQPQSQPLPPPQPGGDDIGSTVQSGSASTSPVAISAYADTTPSLSVTTPDGKTLSWGHG